MPTVAAQRLKTGQTARALGEYVAYTTGLPQGWVTVQGVDHLWSGTVLTVRGHDYRVDPNERFEVLTPAQQDYLDRVRRQGAITFNGRAAKPIKALEAAGLVTVDWDMRPQAKGNGIELVQRITVTPKEA